MKRYVWIVNPTVNNCYFIIALVAVSVLVTEGNVSISECPQSGGQAHRQGHIPDDGQPVKFTCENISINEAVFWVLRPKSNVTLSLKCDSPSQPCTPNNTDFQVSRGNETSVLTVVHNHKRWLVTGTVVCAVGDSNSNVYTTCNVKFACSTSISSTTPQTPTGEQTSTDGEGNEEKDDGLRIAAIAGGAAAFLVIIIIIIVVVVVVRRRKRQKKAHVDNNILEEHVNPMYGSGDEPDTTSPSSSKPSGVALRIPTDTSNNENNAATVEYADNAFDAGYSSMAFGEQQTPSPSSTPSPGGQSSQNTASQPGFSTNTATPVVVTDADIYTAVDGMDQEQTSGPVQDHAAEYSTVGGPSNSTTAAPSGDVYAVVQKSGPRVQSTTANTSVSPSNLRDSADGANAFVDVSRSSAPAPPSKAPSGDPISDNADNTYAVVNKSSSQGKGTGANTTPDSSNSTQQAQSGDVYAQVDKSSKQNGSTPENNGEGQSNVYAQVDKTPKGNNSTPVQQTQAQDQKPEPGIKPKPALKPKPSSNV